MSRLDVDRRTQVIGALAEGNSIGSTERITSIHRYTIMRLLVVQVGVSGMATSIRIRRDIDPAILAVWGEACLYITGRPPKMDYRGPNLFWTGHDEELAEAARPYLSNYTGRRPCLDQAA